MTRLPLAALWMKSYMATSRLGSVYTPGRAYIASRWACRTMPHWRSTASPQGVYMRLIWNVMNGSAGAPSRSRTSDTNEAKRAAYVSPPPSNPSASP